MNYEIIKNKAELTVFKEFFLPSLEENEKFYVSLFARKKYCNNPDDLKADKAQLKRFVTDKDRLIDKIRQLEIEVGNYKINGNPVPPESLALYIMLNPRDLKKAAFKTIKELANDLERDSQSLNPHQTALTAMQQSKSRTCYISFDYDGDWELSKLKSFCEEAIGNLSAFNLLKTRGGYHIIVSPDMIDKVKNRTWYRNLEGIEGIDVSGDILTPVPGCVQGGFVPYLVQ